jgi:hypothetical protein
MEKKLVEKYLTGFKDFILFIYFCRNSIYWGTNLFIDNSYKVPNIGLFCYLIIIQSLRGKYYYHTHFTGKKTGP